MKTKIKIILCIYALLLFNSCKKKVNCNNQINGKFTAKAIIVDSVYSLGTFFGKIEIKDNKFYQYLDNDTDYCDICIDDRNLKLSNCSGTASNQPWYNSNIEYKYYTDSIDIYGIGNQTPKIIYRFVRY